MSPKKNIWPENYRRRYTESWQNLEEAEQQAKMVRKDVHKTIPMTLADFPVSKSLSARNSDYELLVDALSIQVSATKNLNDARLINGLDFRAAWFHYEKHKEAYMEQAIAEDESDDNEKNLAGIKAGQTKPSKKMFEREKRNFSCG